MSLRLEKKKKETAAEGKSETGHAFPVDTIFGKRYLCSFPLEMMLASATVQLTLPRKTIAVASLS
jgi:hypothetical protein